MEKAHLISSDVVKLVRKFMPHASPEVQNHKCASIIAILSGRPVSLLAEKDENQLLRDLQNACSRFFPPYPQATQLYLNSNVILLKRFFFLVRSKE